MDTSWPRVSVYTRGDDDCRVWWYVGSFWRNERTGEGGSEMIYESGSEKEKKVQPSDRTSDELGRERKRERGGKSGGVSASARRKGVWVSEINIYIYIYMWVYGRENERGTRETEREREPLLLRFYSLRPSPSPLPLPLPSPLYLPSFPTLPSHRQKVINTLGRCVGEAHACRSRHHRSFTQILRETAVKGQRSEKQRGRGERKARFRA